VAPIVRRVPPPLGREWGQARRSLAVMNARSCGVGRHLDDGEAVASMEACGLLQEGLVTIGFVTVGITIVAASILVLSGLRRTPML
jgi:hypothetical protein